VDELVQNLVRNSDARVPFTVRVIDSDDLNAFALPGGFLYINTGLILEAQTEAELAGVLAHEIAHVTQRHGVRQIIGSLGLKCLASVLCMISKPPRRTWVSLLGCSSTIPLA
jgi:predicted Zn-dependent protease